MTLPVVLHDRAKKFLRDNAAWWAKYRSPEQAQRWFEEFVDAIDALSETYGQYPLAAESPSFPFRVHELHYGLGKRPTHRALYTVRPEMVYVFLIRHLAQKPVSPDDAVGNV